MKKAQSMGINLVIVAAIAILVLLIIGILVGRGGTSLRQGLASCESKGGFCSSAGTQPEGYRADSTGSCSDDGDRCYVPDLT